MQLIARIENLILKFKETEEYFNDGSHIIYVNAGYKDDTELGKLMHDFSVTEPDDMKRKVRLFVCWKKVKEDA